MFCTVVKKDIGKYEPIIKEIQKRNMRINASFVFGLDSDYPDVFKKTVEWCEKMKIDAATFHISTPYPGTKLFERLEKQERVFSYNWEDYDTTKAVFKPLNMTPEQLEEGLDFAYREFYSLKSTWSRARGGLFEKLIHTTISKLYKRAPGLW